MNELKTDADTVKNLRKRVKDWMQTHGHYVRKWGKFTRLEGMDYWAVWVTLYGEQWGIHVYDNGEIKVITVISKPDENEGC